MNLTGRLKGNFIAIEDKSHFAKANTVFQFRITELRNIKIINAKLVDDTTYNRLIESGIIITNEKNKVHVIESTIDLPFQEGVQTVKGINPLRLSNIKLESTKKISKGYFFKIFKGIRLIDSLFALAWNIFIFIPSLLDPKRKKIGNVTDEIYFGKIEADFVGQSPSATDLQNTDLNFLNNETIAHNESDEIDLNTNNENSAVSL